jgi:aminoglycoside phosphotransferase (APT) family kinase protein
LQTNVPVAEIIAVDESCVHFPWRYLIQTRIKGHVWANIADQLTAEQQTDSFRQIGQAVAEIHRIQFPAFGEIASDEGTTSFRLSLLQRAGRTIHQADWRERFAEVVENRKALFDSMNRAVLCHDDLHHYNLMFDETDGKYQLVAVLDFDKAWAGHAETDLARLDFWDNMMGIGFKEAYQAIHPVDPGYMERRAVYQLMWCLEYAVQTPRHNADLRRVCQELGITPISL